MPLSQSFTTCSLFSFFLSLFFLSFILFLILFLNSIKRYSKML
jgi:hypothetical protein